MLQLLVAHLQSGLPEKVTIEEEELTISASMQLGPRWCLLQCSLLFCRTSAMDLRQDETTADLGRRKSHPMRGQMVVRLLPTTVHAVKHAKGTLQKTHIPRRLFSTLLGRTGGSERSGW
jgi:hypothetical protein